MQPDMEPLIDVTTGNKTMPVANVYHEINESILWPRNPTGWVFLGRAVHAVGRLLFPTWKKYTPYGLLPDSMVGAAWGDVLMAEEEQSQYASWLINKRGDDADYIYRTNRPFDYLEPENECSTVTDAEWDLACDLSQEEWAIGMGNRRMFDEVQLHLVQEAEAGRIIFGSRPLHGGEPKPMPKDWWFTDRYRMRFETLTFDPADPFAQTAPDQKIAQHLFIQADGLADLLDRKPRPEKLDEQPTIVENLSSYMRLMLEVQDHLQIEPSAPPKKASIVHEIQSRWSAYDLPASANLVNAMATLLRDPESQAGRGRKA